MDDSLDSLYFLSSLGWLMIAATSRGISMLNIWGTQLPSSDETATFLQTAHPGLCVESGRHLAFLQQAKQAIQLYFLERAQLPMFPLDMRQGTPFQKTVWKSLCSISFGQTRSYSEVARMIGHPRSARAVGQACGRNPIPIIVPCHRVIAADGDLGGYSGGLHIKVVLLDLEKQEGKFVKVSHQAEGR